MRLSGAVLSFDVFNTHVKFGVAVWIAVEDGVVAVLDSLFLMYEEFSISQGSIGLQSYMRSYYSVICSPFIALRRQYSTTFSSSVALVKSLRIFKDFVALKMGFCIFNHLREEIFSPFLIVENTHFKQHIARRIFVTFYGISQSACPTVSRVHLVISTSRVH